MLLLLTACLIWGKQASNVSADSFSTPVKQCHNVDANYQEVYSFETENYYINVCQSNNKFYYYRQSKLNQSNNILIPAQAVSRGDTFQATVGKTTYFVGIDSDRHYSSVMLNNNEIVFEPEIKPAKGNSVAGFPGANSPSSQSVGYRRRQENENRLDNASLELDKPEEEQEQVLVCARKKSAFHPRLEGWQRLIGSSVAFASKYAHSNGYSLTYDKQNPHLALISTEDGQVINLDIAANEEVIERVCIQPAAED
ncbi:MAG: hypothetical protein AAF652_01240 [Cyanobacteria bacterium P01_C01_bin.72]